ncbi:MAG: Fe-S-cluster-containing hydrogenase [Mariniblastus sp.]
MNKPHNKINELPSTLPSDSPEFNEAIERDFGGALDGQDGDGFSRRRWLQLMGASLALGGMSGCRYQEEKIAPFAFRPTTRVPGIPEKFASMTELGGVAEPLLATNYDGRPIKLDGNPEHPDSMGASSTYTQARILEFYDPDRLRVSLASKGPETDAAAKFEETTWDIIVRECKFPTNLKGVAILAEPSASPSLMRLQGEFTEKGGSWFTYASINDDNTRAGIKQAFGAPHRPHYKFDEANIIVTLDADPLLQQTGSIANSIAFAKGRDADNKKMSRLYSVESQFTTTGAAADHRISVPSSKIAGFAATLAAEVERRMGLSGDAKTEVDASLPYRKKVLAAMAADLVNEENQGKSVIVAGERQPPEVHALVHSLNEKLKNHGKTITFTKLPDPNRPPALESIKSFAQQLSDGTIKSVVILGGNPVFDAPRSLKLDELIAKAPNSVHVSYYKNETSLACKWVSAVAHPLESWKDGFSNNGSVLIGQPLINPLFGGKSVLETLATFMGNEVVSGQAIVRETLGLSEADWKKAVHDGFVSGSVGEAVEATAKAAPAIPADDSWATPWDESSLEFVFAPSLSLYDGRFANSAWLQELPDFFTKIAWDNVASISPRTAEALNLKQNTLMTIKLNGEEQNIPVNIQPGQADGSIGVEIGYGRTMAGRVGGDVSSNVDPVGHDVGAIRSLDHWLVATAGTDAAIKTRTNYRLAVVQEPWTIDETGRDEIQARMFRNYNKTESDRSSLIREGSFESYGKFLEKHPIESHEAAETKPAASRTNAMLKSGSLPVMNQVSYVPEEKDVEHGDDHGHDDHAHGHKAQWPEAFHMHHDLFDITPGVRELYKNEDPTLTNVWGKSIDLNKCIGCNSCVIACQSENNVPVVGKADVWRGREMHWIRIDRYYGDNLYNAEAKEDDKQIVHQPVACHHCENAPCETVCPVAATVHSSEGLNDMVYNRCIGTRYCGNNCPYKVRRFNYFNYSDAVTFLKYPGADKLPAGDRNLQNLMMNPEVTIRSRGVMEKCSYCVQRIQNTKIQAKNEHREIGPNEITTACQDACPTQAIEFGDLHNAESRVAKAHANPRAYSMLEELNNRPRTMYLARVRNPHIALVDWDDRNPGGRPVEAGGHDGDHDEHKGDDHKGDDHKGDGDADKKKAADH